MNGRLDCSDAAQSQRLQREHFTIYLRRPHWFTEHQNNRFYPQLLPKPEIVIGNTAQMLLSPKRLANRELFVLEENSADTSLWSRSMPEMT